MDSAKSNIAIDVMGADLGEKEILLGVKHALDTIANLPHLTLVGDEAIIAPILKEIGLNKSDQVSIFHASEVIGMDEKPIQSLKRKKDSSMIRAIELVKNKSSLAVVSCGNTGSLMATSTIRLRPMQGIYRPALSSVIPSKSHHFILIDAGANPDPDPIQLVHNAILGTIHSRLELGVKEPKVGLLTIGTEEGKGTDRIDETHKLLKSLGGLINYTGLIEGFDVFDEDVHVVVCDGFVGNILVKTCESLFHTLKEVFVEELTKNPWRKVGALLSQGAFKSIKKQFNPDRYGAAPLLGINGIVIKSHGSSNRHAMSNAIKSTVKFIQHDMNDLIHSYINEANKIIKPKNNPSDK